MRLQGPIKSVARYLNANLHLHHQNQDGLGQCVTNRSGKVMCSSKTGGWAAIDANGQAVCETSCVAEK